MHASRAENTLGIHSLRIGLDDNHDELLGVASIRLAEPSQSHLSPDIADLAITKADRHNHVGIQVVAPHTLLELSGLSDGWVTHHVPTPTHRRQVMRRVTRDLITATYQNQALSAPMHAHTCLSAAFRIGESYVAP
jgi:hypothetical protein